MTLHAYSTFVIKGELQKRKKIKERKDVVRRSKYDASKPIIFIDFVRYD